MQAIYLMTSSDQSQSEPKVGDSPRVRTRDIFSKMDENNDGVISKDEFIKGCLHDETLYKLLSGTTTDEIANNT